MSELQNMRDDAPDQVIAIESSIGQVQDQIDDLTLQINAVRYELCEADTTALIIYLNDVKYPELESLYGGGPFSFIPGSGFNTISYSNGNISNWIVRDSTGNDVYQYHGINWDDDTSITQFIVDYAFGNDYLTRPLTTGATYGLIPSRNNLYIALGILENNRDKIAASIDVFSRYIT